MCNPTISVIMLSTDDNIHCILQPHLSKLFGNIKRLVLPRDVLVSPPITAMVSAEGENIALPK